MESSPLAGVRVLLVDDDELVREAVRDYLLECGASVVTADSARGGLVQFRSSPPDVLVSDLRMPPGEDGFWLIAAVRALAPAPGGAVPAIAITGDLTSARKARDAGFQAVLDKPMRLAELSDLVLQLATRAPC